MMSYSPPSAFVYPYAAAVSYSEDAGYRAALRSLIGMAPADLSAYPADADAVSKDEMDYDFDAVLTFIDRLWGATETTPALVSLYVMAAGAMLSEDPSIGLVVLMAYDNLAMFHACLATHFDPFLDVALADNEFYVALVNKMAHKSTA
jgi:hypothetical protein